MTAQQAPVRPPRSPVDARNPAARVIGLDLSLTATGIATITTDTGTPTATVHTVTSTGRRGDNLTQRWVRLAHITNDVMAETTGVDLVVIEGPAIMSQHGSNWDRAGLWWAVVSELLDAEIPVAVVPPATVKRWATGRGNADKAAVAVGVARLWPDVEPANDNEFDALCLATIGAQHLGMDVPSRAHHADAVAKVEWPDVATVEVTGD